MTTPSTELIIVPGIEANKLALITPESAHAVKAAYLPHFTAFLELEKQANEIAVNSPKLARVMRLDLRKVRVAAEKDRKALGEEGRRYVDAVNQVYNLLEDRLKPVEQRMESIEKAEEIANKERAEALKTARLAELTPYALTVGQDLTFYDLANMPEAQYIALRDSTKAAADAKVLAAKKAEEERIAAEVARAKREQELAAENARLAKEAAERQKALDVERAKAEEARRKAAAEVERVRKENEAKLEAERKKAADEAARIKKAADEKAAKERADREAIERAAEADRKEEARKLALERAKADAKAKAERDALAKQAEDARKAAQKLADEAKAREDAEKARKAKEAEEASKAAKAPDKEKILAYAKAIESIPVPVLSSSKPLSDLLKEQSTKMVKWLRAESGKL